MPREARLKRPDLESIRPQVSHFAEMSIKSLLDDKFIPVEDLDKDDPEPTYTETSKWSYDHDRVIYRV